MNGLLSSQHAAAAAGTCSMPSIPYLTMQRVVRVRGPRARAFRPRATIVPSRVGVCRRASFSARVARRRVDRSVGRGRSVDRAVERIAHRAPAPRSTDTDARRANARDARVRASRALDARARVVARRRRTRDDDARRVIRKGSRARRADDDALRVRRTDRRARGGRGDSKAAANEREQPRCFRSSP